MGKLRITFISAAVLYALALALIVLPTFLIGRADYYNTSDVFFALLAKLRLFRSGEGTP
jgi:hypothetical protein